MKILIIDNYDSFTYNIAHAVRSLGIEPTVARNDAVTPAEALGFDRIILSPGPGIPSEAGLMPEIIAAAAGKVPMLGVCLGHQAIGEHFGARLRNLSSVYHGIQSTIDIVKPDYLFDGLPAEIQVGRYHSWVVDGNGLPDCLEVTATSRDGEIMAMRHKEMDIRGVQFHPESIMTPTGTRMIENWINH